MCVGCTSRLLLWPLPLFWLLPPFLCSSILGPEAAFSRLGSALVPRRCSLGSPALRRLLLCIVFASRINSWHVSSQFCNKSVKKTLKGLVPFFWVCLVGGACPDHKAEGEQAATSLFKFNLKFNPLECSSGGLQRVFSSDHIINVCCFPAVTSHDPCRWSNSYLCGGI